MYLFEKNLSKIDKMRISASYAIRITLILAMIGAVFNTRWYVLFMSGLTLFLTFLPNLIKRNYQIHLPVEFEFVIVVFIYAAMFLGEVQGYYTLFWWWDGLLHAVSSVAIGFIGFAILYVLFKGKKIRTSPILVAVFSFSFAVAIGSLWEIFEFFMDNLFSLNMQKSGLVDTMWDLIINSAGAFLASIIGYVYLRRRKIALFGRLIKNFINENPELFK